jgi:biotin operon repressor
VPQTLRRNSTMTYSLNLGEGHSAAKTGNALKKSSRDVWKALKNSAEKTNQVLWGTSE